MGRIFVLQTLKLISKVPKAYKQWGKYNFFADALKAKMKEVDIPGEHIHIKSKYQYMPSKSYKEHGGNISENGWVWS